MSFKKFLNPPYSKLLIFIAGVSVGLSKAYPLKIDLILMVLTVIFIFLSVKVEANEKIKEEIDDETKN